MNEEIKQLIEEEAHKYGEQCVGNSYVKYQADCGYRAGANFILSKWQEANRWRKMSEELPTEDIYVLIGNPKSSYYYVAKWYSKRNRFVDTRGHSIYYSDNLEWKPIE